MSALIIARNLQVAEHIRRPKSILLIDGIEVGSYRQCCHCGIHYMAVRGSGILRSFCRNCMGDTCGKQNCIEQCCPIEKQIDLLEKGTPVKL